MTLGNKGISTLRYNTSFTPSIGIAALANKNNIPDEYKGVGSLHSMNEGGEVPSERELAFIAKSKRDQIEKELQDILGFRIYDNLLKDGVLDNFYKFYDQSKDARENLSDTLEDEFKSSINIPFKKEIREIIKADDPEKELEKHLNTFGTNKINQVLDSVNLPINLKKTSEGLKLDKNIYRDSNFDIGFSGYKPDKGDFTGDVNLRYRNTGRFGNIDVRSTLDETGDIDTTTRYKYRKGPFSLRAQKRPGKDVRGDISYTLKDLDVGKNQKLNLQTKLNNLSEAKLALDYSYNNPRTGGFVDAGLGLSNRQGPELNVAFGKKF